MINRRRTTNVSACITTGAALCAAFAAVALPGCNVIAPAYYVLKGPPKTPAVFELDENRPTVVFVDDRASVLPRRSLREQIGQEAESTLLERRTIKKDEMISTLSALRTAAGERYGDAMTIGEIGNAIGAEVVIYVTVDTFTISRDGVSLSPLAEARVKVIDVAAQSRLFPPTGDGYPVRLDPPSGTGQIPTSRAARNSAENALARSLGVEVAQLFYKHLTD